MNKKAQGGEFLKDQAIYLLFALLFVAVMMFFLIELKNQGAYWSEIYAKEIVKVVNAAKDGDEIILNVQTGTGIAVKNDVDSASMFVFRDNDVCVRLSKGRTSCYSYFNNLKITDAEVEWGAPVNLLHFKVEARK